MNPELLAQFAVTLEGRHGHGVGEPRPQQHEQLRRNGSSAALPTRSRTSGRASVDEPGAAGSAGPPVVLVSQAWVSLLRHS